MAIGGETEIDIALLKIVDWLAERRFLQTQWRSKNKALQLKATDLSQALTEELQAFKGLKDYLSAKQLRDKLVEGAEKNFLGYYKGEAGVWDKLVRAYEIENIHIGETALQLIRNGEYEIPFLQSQIGKQQQQLVDYEKKEAEYSRMALNAQKNHLQECDALGIEGSDIPQELLDLTKSLPRLLYEAANQLKSEALKEAVEYYTEFTSHVSQGKAKSSRNTLLPVISEIQSAQLQLPEAEDAQPALPGTPDNTLEPEDVSQEPAEVDWDVEMEVGSQNGGADDIDWDIDADSSGPVDVAIENGANEAEFDQGDIVSRLLNDASFRSATMIELSELSAFIKQRCSELASESAQPLAAATPASLQQTSLSSLQQMGKHISESQAALAAEKVKMLTALRASTPYFTRTCAALEQQAGQESKFYRLQREVHLKRQELQGKLVEDAAKLSATIAETKQLKTFVEEQITGLCKDCKIHITGDFNNALMK